jgi:hypothetical protein
MEDGDDEEDADEKENEGERLAENLAIIQQS